MWMMTPEHGFYSAVEHRDDPKKVIVRTRAREDAERLLPLLPGARVVQMGNADYPFRIVTTKRRWKKALVKMVDSITYDNVKDEVKRQRGPERAGIFSRVWSVLLDLEQPGEHGLYGGPYEPVTYGHHWSDAWPEEDPVWPWDEVLPLDSLATLEEGEEGTHERRSVHSRREDSTFVIGERLQRALDSRVDDDGDGS